MLEKYIPKRFANALVKHVAAVTLFIPYYYSFSYNPYYQDFVLATFFAALFMMTVFTSWKLSFRRNGVLLCILSVLLVAYNGYATYINYRYHHWYGEQINTTLAFLAFIVLLAVRDGRELVDRYVILATIHLIVISNVLALLYRALDKYSSFIFFNTEIRQGKFPLPSKPYSWLYFHKSQYSLLLVLCIAFFVVYRHYFRNRLTYCLSQAVLIAALYFSDTYTSMAAALIIFAAQFADYWFRTKWYLKLISLAVVPVSLAYVVKALYVRINENRNMATLGSRTMIWEAFIGHIQEHPHGVGMEFSEPVFQVTEWFFTNNCHNVFMNHMFRFSIPVGLIFTLMFAVIIIFSIIKKFSFLTIGIWIALLIPMCMDYSLFASELPFFLFIVYCMFFREEG